MSKDKLDQMFEQLKDDPEALFKKIKKENENYNQELRAKAKTPEELTVGLEYVVADVNCYQGSTSFTPHSEIVLGGRSPTFNGGHTYRTELKVQSGTLVKKLEFYGWPPLEVGDVIKAYIFKGKQEYERGHEVIPKTIKEFDSFFKGKSVNVPSHWIERKYQPVERPSKIEKLRDGKVVATYHNH